MVASAQILTVLADFVFALNHAEAMDTLQRALDGAIRVRRYGYHGTRKEVLEQFDGLDQVQQWLARTPPTIEFFLLESTLQATGHQSYSVRYGLTAPDDFRGGGLWEVKVDADGRIRELDHRPDDLDAKYGAPVLETSHSKHLH